MHHHPGEEGQHGHGLERLDAPPVVAIQQGQQVGGGDMEPEAGAGDAGAGLISVEYVRSLQAPGGQVEHLAALDGGDLAVAQRLPAARAALGAVLDDGVGAIGELEAGAGLAGLLSRFPLRLVREQLLGLGSGPATALRSAQPLLLLLAALGDSVRRRWLAGAPGVADERRAETTRYRREER